MGTSCVPAILTMAAVRSSLSVPCAWHRHGPPSHNALILGARNRETTGTRNTGGWTEPTERATARSSRSRGPGVVSGGSALGRTWTCNDRSLDWYARHG